MSSTERLVHFSDQVVTKIHDRHSQPGHMKPAGFWVSVEGNGDGWSDWCRDNGYGSLTHEHEVTLATDANILRIGTVDQLDAFTQEFDKPHGDGGWYRLGNCINWQAVADRYQGILITPYLWGRRLAGDAFWYYGWDCASGCIWDPEAVASIRALSAVRQ